MALTQFLAVLLLAFALTPTAAGGDDTPMTATLTEGFVVTVEIGRAHV